MPNRHRIAGWTMGIILVAVAGFFLIRWMGGEQDRRDEVVIVTSPKSAKGGGADAPLYDLPQLISPPKNEMAAADDPRVTRLIERHNAWVERLAGVTLRGGCVWSDGSPRESPAQPRQMSIRWRPSDAVAAATVTCGNDSCTLREPGKVAPSAGSAMHIDAHYLLMFRTYNPRDFEVAEVLSSAATRPAGPVVLANEKRETLEFDEKSGRLLKATMTLAQGEAVVQFDAPAPLGGSAEEQVQIPTILRVRLPAIPPFEEKASPEITFTIDAEKSE